MYSANVRNQKVRYLDRFHVTTNKKVTQTLLPSQIDVCGILATAE